MTTLNIHLIPVLEDNYAYVVSQGSLAIVIDPGEAKPIADYLVAHALTLSHILITHYDHDHIGGVDSLRSHFHASVIGPASTRIRLDAVAAPGVDLGINGFTVQVIDTPGHAFPHVAYYLPDPGWLFSGDCLFGAGCGRLARDVAPVMWASLQSLNQLPADTQVYFGHEYTRSNLAFARAVEPDNPNLADRIARVEACLKNGGVTSPSTLAEERLTNPFLRTDSIPLRKHLGLPHASGVEVFVALRRAKNLFRG